MDNDKNEAAEPEAFEREWKRSCESYTGNPDCNTYADSHQEAGWLMWQAGRRAKQSESVDEVVERGQVMARMLRIKKSWAKSIPIHGDSIANDFERAAEYIGFAMVALSAMQPQAAMTEDEAVKISGKRAEGYNYTPANISQLETAFRIMWRALVAAGVVKESV